MNKFLPMTTSKMQLGDNLPKLADVIEKIKKTEQLCAEEEYVYLVNIEGLSEEEAITFVQNNYTNSEQCE